MNSYIWDLEEQRFVDVGDMKTKNHSKGRMLEKTPDIRELHECDKSEGKIVAISSDNVGNTYCSYCNQMVDYKPLWNNKEFQDKLNKVMR